MKADFSSLNLVVCLAGAIILAALSYRAESPVVAAGLGLASMFLLTAAFRAYRWKRSHSSGESRGEG
jgi:hypothetical protein